MKLNDVGSVDINAPLHAGQLADGWYAVGLGMLIPCRDRNEVEALVEDMNTNGGTETEPRTEKQGCVRIVSRGC